MYMYILNLKSWFYAIKKIYDSMAIELAYFWRCDLQMSVLKSEPKASRQAFVVKYAYSLPLYGDTSRSANRSLALLSSRYVIRELMGATQMLSAGAHPSCRTVFPFRDQYFRFFDPDCALVMTLSKEILGL